MTWIHAVHGYSPRNLLFRRHTFKFTPSSRLGNLAAHMPTELISPPKSTFPCSSCISSPVLPFQTATTSQERVQITRAPAVQDWLKGRYTRRRTRWRQWHGVIAQATLSADQHSCRGRQSLWYVVRPWCRGGNHRLRSRGSRCCPRSHSTACWLTLRCACS